jgi:hypothetical protein
MVNLPKILYASTLLFKPENLYFHLIIIVYLQWYSIQLTFQYFSELSVKLKVNRNTKDLSKQFNEIFNRNIFQKPAHHSLWF